MSGLDLVIYTIQIFLRVSQLLIFLFAIHSLLLSFPMHQSPLLLEALKDKQHENHVMVAGGMLYLSITETFGVQFSFALKT